MSTTPPLDAIGQSSTVRLKMTARDHREFDFLLEQVPEDTFNQPRTFVALCAFRAGLKRMRREGVLKVVNEISADRARESAKPNREDRVSAQIVPFPNTAGR